MPAGVAERLDALAMPSRTGVKAAAGTDAQEKRSNWDAAGVVGQTSLADSNRPADGAAAASDVSAQRGHGSASAQERDDAGAGVAPAGHSPPGAENQSLSTPVGSAGRSEIKAAIAKSRSAFIGIGVLSCLINILMLTGPLFMLQVFDRVMTSGSMPTLLALSAVTALLFAMGGFFEVVRTRIVVRAGVEIDQRLSGRIFRASLRRSLKQQGASVTALRDLDTLRQFASGPAPTTFFDAPWTPIYLLVIFLVHWALGLTALLGAGLILVIALASERTARAPLNEANLAAAKSLDMADSAQRNAEALAAMGMVEAFRARWQAASLNALAWQVHAADRLGSASALSKSVRLLLQSLMLAVGAALAINNEISAGAIIAGTLIFGRAMAPVEQVVVHWKSFVRAREAFDTLAKLLRDVPVPPARTELPPPKGHLTVSQLRVAAPDTGRVILANLGFEVKPGEVCAVIGPSASGKSTLARALVGLWPPATGKIAIDSADLRQWDPEALGQHIGYLPQDVELFAGTVRDNICRFREDATDALVVEAAKMAHAHELILALPQGYDTQLGAFGTYLSAGQRQRIGLARALFGNPALVVLDEPNANLDRLGDEALTAALAGTKARGQAVVLISHRVQAIGIADKVLFVDRGVQRAFGSQAEVMKLFRQAGSAGDAVARSQPARDKSAQDRPAQGKSEQEMPQNGAAVAPEHNAMQPVRRAGSAKS
jgi:PrtD family type I secretion system ABC transporter